MGSLPADRTAVCAPNAPRPRAEARGPLSFGQRRIRLRDRRTAGSPSPHLSVTLRFTGPLDPARLAAAVASVAARHDVLFTVIEDGAQEPYQRVLTERELPCPLLDLGAPGTNASAARRHAERLIGEDATRAFTSAEAAKLRAHLYRLAEDVHWLQLTFHRIACDAWSLDVFQRELAQAYAAGGESTAPAPAFQYADYALWQREMAETEAAKQALKAWISALEGAPAVLELGADHPRSAEPTRRARTALFDLPGATLDEAAHFAAHEGTTLQVVLTAAFQALLARHSGSEDIVLGSPVAGRSAADLDDLVGCFADLLVVRTALADDPSLRTLVSRTKADVLDAVARSVVPFDFAVEHLQPEQTLGHNPVVQVVFALHEREDRAGDFADGVLVERVAVPASATEFDLTWSVHRTSAGARLEVEYAADLFDAESIETFAEHWETLLHGALAEPDRPLSEINLASAAEAERLREWSGTVRPLPGVGGTVHGLVAALAAARPEAVALSYAGQSLTYAELERRATALAHRLRARGVGPEHCVGVCMQRSSDAVVACLAVLKAGGVYVPVDVAFPAARTAFMLEGVGAKLVLVHEATAGTVPEGPWSVIDIDDADPASDGPDAAGDRAGALPEVHPENGCYVIYTSGSTGRPKGTMVTHRNVVRLIEGICDLLPLDHHDVWTLFHSFAFDFSVWELWGALTTGGRVVVVPYDVSRDTYAFHALVRAERVTILSQTPSAFRSFETADERSRGGEPSALRAVVFGGEALHQPSLRRWAARYGYESPLLVNMYGITETTVHVTYLPQTQEDLGRELTRIGLPLPDLAVHVLDARGRPCPIGVPGEIHVGGGGVTRGYHGRPALTAERFVPDHLSDGAHGSRLYRSGDLARWHAHGSLEYVGRADAQVKIRGYRIETGEVEAALEEHPQVLEAAVVAGPGADGQTDLTGYVVLAAATPAPSTDELRERLRRRLPDYMVPRHLVVLDALPLTAQGKVDRGALTGASTGSSTTGSSTAGSSTAGRTR